MLRLACTQAERAPTRRATGFGFVLDRFGVTAVNWAGRDGGPAALPCPGAPRVAGRGVTTLTTVGVERWVSGAVRG